jgi:cephalosporin hydroxylase
VSEKQPDQIAAFEEERRATIATYPSDGEWQEETRQWVTRSFNKRYMYNFDWLGRPLIQFPADIVAFQEVVWAVKPELIIETGIAHGGSLVLSASLLAMLEYEDAVRSGGVVDPLRPRRRVVGVDIDIRSHNRAAIEAHPMSGRITMFEGSSVSGEMAARVAEEAVGSERVLVVLDSNHTHEHVRAELELYAPLVTPGSYCIVFDTIVEDLPSSAFPDRPWAPGNSPKTAVRDYLASHPEFAIDTSVSDKLLISASPDGWLRRT